jgi:D-alanine---D-serine ligase
MKKKLAVLFGGYSSEYSVSLVSASAVIGAVNQNAYDLLAVGITRDGNWFYYPGPVEAIAGDTWRENPGCVPVLPSANRADHGFWLVGPEGPRLHRLDMVLPVLHGTNGEDGAVQGLLELAGIPIVGSGCLCSALCMDKEVAHHLAMQAGIPWPAFVTVYKNQGPPARVAEVVGAQMAHVPLPWFVKPAAEGSSYGVARVDDLAQLPGALEYAFGYKSKVVVEQGISGFEVGCAVLGNENPVVGAVDAIALQGGFFDFHEKYNLETAKILLPAPVSDEAAEAIKAMALRLYRLFGCRGMARVDLFYSAEGEIIFNEINTIPGMTEHSRYPGMLGQVGIGFAQMVARLLELAGE